MSVQQRALLIGLIGPGLQGIGLTWQALHLAISHWGTSLSARHLMYEPGTLLVVVGFFVSLVCVPVALEVVRATEAEVQIPVYGPAPAEEAERPQRQRFRRSRASR